MSKEQLSKETKQLARDLLVRFIDHDELDTITELEATMEDCIDTAIEFEIRLAGRRWNGFKRQEKGKKPFTELVEEEHARIKGIRIEKGETDA